MSVSFWITADPQSRTASQRIWQIQSGSLALFAVTVNPDGSLGKRRYLFRATADEALFEMRTPAECPYRILAIAFEEPELVELDPAQLDVEPLEQRLMVLAQCWRQQLQSVFSDSVSLRALNSSKEELNWDSLQPQLAALHGEFLQQLALLEQQDQEQTRQRLAQRQQRDDAAAQSALRGLADVIQVQPTDSQAENSELLAAVGAIGRYLGLSIRAPLASENWDSLNDPIEAIARASHIRVRRITLETGWQTQDYGPVLSYRQPEDTPVALLPTKPGQYTLFDPTTQTYHPLRNDQLASLTPVAYTFYRAFPERSLRTWDVIQFALRGQTQDLLNILWVGIAVTLANMFMPFSIGILIDQAIPDASRRLLFQVGFGLLAASLGMAMFQLGQRRLLLRTQTRTDLTTQAAIWDRLLKLKLSFFRQYSTGDLKNRIAAIGQIRALLGGTILPTLLTSLFTLLNLLLLFFYSVDLAWIAIIVAGMALLLTNTVWLMASQKFWQLQELEGTLFGTMVQMIGGISKLRVAGAEKRAFAYWAKQYQRQLTLVMDTQGLEDSLTGLNTVLPVFSSIIFFWFAVPLINPAEAGGSGLSTGAFLAFNAAFGAFIAAITDLSNTSINLLRAGIRWRRVRPILEAEPEVNESKANPGRLAGHLKLDRITFRYRPDGPLILDQVTLEAEPGEFVAIVGPSGSGKSTLIRLLLGFETPENGTIYYDRQDLSELDLTAIRRQLGVVLQNGRITSAALFENIAAGALITLDQAWEAATLASFADDIQAMPMGMHTVISEGGSNLSGGQRQRLLIARALVLKPKILILDEATSALDNQTQADISQNLAQMQVTRVAIAHRLSTIRHADRIYVLEQGSVVQQGTFEQLVEQPGLFQRMMARQLV